MTDLKRLHFSANSVSDISSLAGLINLERLYMNYNDVVDISPLKNLVNLSRINMHDNDIVDIKTLVDNTGIGDGDEIWLENNPLSDLSKNTYIPQLEARGVTVHQ